MSREDIEELRAEERRDRFYWSVTILKWLVYAGIALVVGLVLGWAGAPLWACLIVGYLAIRETQRLLP